MADLREDIVRQGLAAATVSVHVRCADRSPLQSALAHAESWLEAAVAALDSVVPAPPSAAAFANGPFYRPPGSLRCFYYQPDRGVLAFKGLEPLAPDFEQLAQYLEQPCFSPHTMAEHLIFEESKVPGAMTLREACREAELAASVQASHFEHYGEPAQLPLPLRVFRHDDSASERVVSAFRPPVSAGALDHVRERVSGGLGAYAYYYPTAPVRVRDVDYMLSGRSFAARQRGLRQISDPDTAIEGWVRHFARMLHLGYVPGTLASLRSGLVCDPQNACVNGGFVDLDSVASMADLASDTALFAALQLGFDALLRTIRTYVAGKSDPTRPEACRPRPELHALHEHAACRMRTALAEQARPSLTLDDRVRSYFEPAENYGALARRLESYYAEPNTYFEERNASFTTIAPRVLASLRTKG